MQQFDAKKNVLKNLMGAMDERSMRGLKRKGQQATQTEAAKPEPEAKEPESASEDADEMRQLMELYEKEEFTPAASPTPVTAKN